MSKFSELINGNTPVLVDMFADWCAPCKALSPILKEAKAELGEKVKIIKIDVDKNPQVAQKFEVRGVPTLILFKEGKLLWKQAGLVQKEQIIELINEHS